LDGERALMADVAPRIPGARQKRAKYGNKIREVDGLKFDSQKECKRWFELKMLERGGIIRNLQRQVVYSMVVNGHKICDYIADHQYEEISNGKWLRIVEDVKSEATRKERSFLLKRKLLRACHGVTLRVV
jgi:hypothetical protein